MLKHSSRGTKDASSRVGALLAPFRTLAADARLCSILLIVASVAAIAWVNGPWQESYNALWSHAFSVGWAPHVLTLSIREWINDALMALFFLVVGLEIERELLVGSLSTRRAAALPIAAAIGGMIVPAALYISINGTSAHANGWGVPMATDIAFALGLLALFAPGLPTAVRAFLAALAIVDDLGAILVIALAYGAPPNWSALAFVAVCTAVLFTLRALDVRALSLYAIIAVPLWLCLHAGGIHPSLTGVIVAFAIPPQSPGDHTPSPSMRAELGLHVWVVVGIMPLFALANAGINVREIFSTDVQIPVRAMIGVFAGLVLGKPLGIVGATWLALRLQIAELPTGLTWRRVIIVGCFGGIGFTMSIFVTSLAFSDSGTANAVRGAVLMASVMAAAIGAAVARLFERRIAESTAAPNS